MSFAIPSQTSDPFSVPSPEIGIPPYPVYRFTVAEYEQLTRAGILTEDSNVELLEGWIVPKMPRNPPHDNVIDLINYLLQRLLPLGWFVRIQNSAVTSDSVPEPDVSVVRGKPGSYPNRHPTGADLGLVIEVADSTVLRDRRKAEIYARAGVPHYWIVNLEDQQIELYSQPVAIGESLVYQSPLILRAKDAILPVLLDGQEVGKMTVGELLAQSVL
ncbi:MAG TPA: Uma2 family endonuclease [Pirellulaceae bacterium]|jgi:Uma2 family endonuclease